MRRILFHHEGKVNVVREIQGEERSQGWAESYCCSRRLPRRPGRWVACSGRGRGTAKSSVSMQ
jgi:hypothetical protein